MFPIPENFRQNTLLLHGEEQASRWLERLPTLLADCARRWQISIFPPFANLSIHYVAPALRADGTPVVIKACSPTREFTQEREALRLLAGTTMVRLLEVDEKREVLLLERLSPGQILSHLVPEQDELATSILAMMMKQTWRPVPASHPFPTVTDWSRGLTKLQAQYQGSYGPFPPRLVDEAKGLFADLIASSKGALLLHGDLHHENVLQSGDSWCVIDPKGLVGDPGYEAGAMFYNPPGWLSTAANPARLLARRVEQLAEILEIEQARIRGWGLAQAVLSAWWTVEGRPAIQPPPDVLAVAEILANLRAS